MYTMHLSNGKNRVGDVPIPESQTIKLAQKDMSHFKPLYNKYYEPILRYVYQRVSDKDIAYDVTSQVFLKAMSNLKKYKDKGFPFSSWLYRIAKSEVGQYYVDQKKRPYLSANDFQLDALKEEISNEKLDNALLIPVLNALSDEETELIEMRFFEKRSFKEMAEILGITENNAKVKTHRVVAKLKKQQA